MEGCLTISLLRRVAIFSTSRLNSPHPASSSFTYAATWFLTVIGLWMLWNALRDGAVGSGRVLLGWMLAGWGIFNLVEGIIDHQLLGLHNVHEGSNELAWDLVFLVSGVALIAGGWLLARRDTLQS